MATSDDDTAPLFDEEEQDDANGAFFTANALGQWNQRAFRKPDKFDTYPGGAQAVWYGPSGSGGDVATEVIWNAEAETFEMSEYNSVVGLFDEGSYDANYPFAVQRTAFTVKAVLKALRDENIKPKRGTILLWAASLGVAQLAYYGGAGEMVESLP